MTDSISIEKYSERSFVVRGDTKPVKDALIEIGGKYNPHLRGGPGWIFSEKLRENVQSWIDSNTPKSYSSVVNTKPNTNPNTNPNTTTSTTSSSDLKTVTKRLDQQEQMLKNIQQMLEIIMDSLGVIEDEEDEEPEPSMKRLL